MPFIALACSFSFSHVITSFFYLTLFFAPIFYYSFCVSTFSSVFFCSLTFLHISFFFMVKLYCVVFSFKWFFNYYYIILTWLVCSLIFNRFLFSHLFSNLCLFSGHIFCFVPCKAFFFVILWYTSANKHATFLCCPHNPWMF